MGAFRNLRRFAREMRHTLTGKRFEQFKSDLLRALGESRCSDFAIGDSVARLGQPEQGRSPRLAVASCLPPARTGIAHITRETFVRAGYAVDLFGHFDNSTDYLAAVHDAKVLGSKARIYALDALPAALSSRRYTAQLYVIGNSDHNLPIVAALRRNQPLSPVPAFVHIHDPCLLNIVEQTCKADRADFANVLRRVYGRGSIASLSSEALLASGIYGARALLADIPLAGVIVNSQAAADMVARELPGMPTHVAFHPVIPAEPPPRAARSGDTLRIGTFGVPGAGKRTEVAAKAARLLRQADRRVDLVIAGYNADTYVSRERWGDVEVHDSPSDAALQRLMSSVDVAVQLRLHNTGESSGIVAKLLALGVPTIVSRIGAFAEYGEAVRYLEPAQGASALAALILAREQDASLDAAMNAYVRSHSPRRHCDLLAGILRCDPVPALRVNSQASL